jgi:protein involved in polysaccharide export with SLBB domain
VKFPGTYAIREDSTRLLDIVEIAGGFTADTFLRGSKIVRKRFTRTGDREFGRLKVTPVSALSPLERSFLKTRIVEEEGVVSLDFGELVERGGDMYNVLLRNGDVIEIARRSLSVKVSGAVVSPGLVSYQECADLNYYLRQAGGLSERARKRKIMIIKGGSENWLRPREVDKIEAGDVVWVPEKTYRDPVELTRNILGMLGSVAMVLTTYITVSQAVTR